MVSEREFVGTRLSVVFNLEVPTTRRHEELTSIGNPILEAQDGVATYTVAVPDGQDYYWKRRYRAINGVVDVELVRTKYEKSQ